MIDDDNSLNKASLYTGNRVFHNLLKTLVDEGLSNIYLKFKIGTFTGHTHIIEEG